MKTSISLIGRSLLLGLLPISFLAPYVASSHESRNTFSPAAMRAAVQPRPVLEQARSAYDFVNSIGINTHLNYFDRIYGNFTFVEEELRSIGILHLRDGIHLQNDDYNDALYGRWKKLGKLGIRFDAVLDPRSKIGPITPQLLEHVDQLTGHTIESFEGPNEMDISGIPGWDSVDRSYQKTIFAAVRSMPNTQHIDVIGPSLANSESGVRAGLTIEDLDVGNLHPYPAAKVPSVVFPEQTDHASSIFGHRQIMFTESGYHNALNDHSDQPAVSEQTAAKYIPRLFLEDFARGIPRTYLYEFLDEAPDPGLLNNQMHWGLIRTDGAEKPAFIAIKRLIADLHDISACEHPAQLAWSLNQAPPSIHHLLLQKSDGEFDLVLWQEVPSYDTRSQAELAIPPVTTELMIGRRAKFVALYEPTQQAPPVKSFTQTSVIPVEIPDHPLIVSIRLN